MAAPIYKGGPPFFKPYVRFRNAVAFMLQNGTVGGSPVSGTTGTGAGKAGPGSIYFDYLGTNGIYSWQNVGTLLSPSWVPDAGLAIPGYARVSLTAAQIIAMGTTPVAILPAPTVVGSAIVVQQIAFEMIATATAFTSGGTVAFNYHGLATAVTGTVAAAIVTATGPTTVVISLGPGIVSTGNVVSNNVGIDITNGTAPFATGTGTAVVHVLYTTITL